ncbi:MAG TPA: hypothetical protein VE569_05835, partial [Acidimicrobiia bacterium]|nr:hypothetical protein [Acidimicrobiia bacterium]
MRLSPWDGPSGSSYSPSRSKRSGSRTAIAESKKLKGDHSWWGFIPKSRNPELPVVLLENTGAVIGLVLAMFGVGMSAVTGDPVWDGIGTLAIGILMLVISTVLTVEMKSLLIGEGATSGDVARLVQAVQGVPKVNRIIDLKTEHLGPEELLVAAKLEFDHSLTTPELSDA